MNQCVLPFPRFIHRRPIFLLGNLLAVSAICAAQAAKSYPERVPDSVKIFVSHGGMVQVTGHEISQCIADANIVEQERPVNGGIVFTPAGAATTNAQESEDMGGILGTWDTQTSVIRSQDNLGSVANGEFCIKVDGPRSNVTEDSGIHQPDVQFELKGNSRYRLSCMVYCERPMDRFVLAVRCQEPILDTSHSMRLRANNIDDTGEYFRNVPGEWTQFNGIITTPDEGEKLYHLWIHHEGTGKLTWYLDDISIVEVSMTTERKAYRTKSHAESSLKISDLNANRVNLFNRGRTVPLGIQNVNPDGGFRPDTVLTFWGDPPSSSDGSKNLFTNENTYILDFDSSAAIDRFRVSKPTGTADGARIVRTHRRTLRVEEENHLDYYRKYDGPPTDRVMWNTFKAPPQIPAEVSFPSIPDLARGKSEVKVRIFLWGCSDLPIRPDHDWSLKLNGAAIGRVTWEGMQHTILDTTVQPVVLKTDVPNVFVIEQANPQLRVDVMSLDWIELTYEADLVPQQDSLEFFVERQEEGLQVRTAPGFTGKELHAFDLIHRQDYQVAAKESPDGFYTEFPIGSEGGRYRVVGPKGFVRPVRLSLSYASDLRSRDTSPQFLIIAHGSYIEALRPLVARRIEQGLDTWVVDIEDLYDEYSFGIINPEAIRLFIDNLLEAREGSEQRLKYVWLVGDATYDYKAIRPGSKNFVPTHHVSDADILPAYSPTFAHDDYFAFGPNGDGPPLAAVGRLPAGTIETVEAYVAKVQEYEEALGQPEAQRKRALLISSKDFKRFSDDMEAQVFSNWSVENITGTGSAEGDLLLRDNIVRTISEGCQFVAFTGHGAYYVWRTGENMNDQRTDMLTDRDINRLTNRGKYPIVLAATCFSALFDAPIHTSSRIDSGVGIYFVEAPERGAIALIGHVGKVEVAAAHRFNRSILQHIITDQPGRLGDHFLLAKQQHPQAGFSGMALIGDPSLLLGSGVN